LFKLKNALLITKNADTGNYEKILDLTNAFKNPRALALYRQYLDNINNSKKLFIERFKNDPVFNQEIEFRPGVVKKGYDFIPESKKSLIDEPTILLAELFDKAGLKPGTKPYIDKMLEYKMFVDSKTTTFLNNAIKLEFGLQEPVSKVTVDTSADVKGTIQLELIEDLVQEGKAKTTIRNYDKVTGVYRSTKSGRLYSIVNRGKVKMVGDKLVGKDFSYTLDEFGKAEGFDNWEGFVKAAKYAGIDIQKGKEVFLYDIEPAQESVSKVTLENSAYRQELFRYLSEQLYKNFGYVNPGSEKIPSIMDIIAAEQTVTDQDRDNLKNRCLIL